MVSAPRRIMSPDPVTLIEAHERVCTERMERIDGTLGRIEETLKDHAHRFDRINLAAWSVAGTLGVLAMSVIAFLLLQVWPPPHPTMPQNVVAVVQKP